MINQKNIVHITSVPETLAFLTGQSKYLKDRGFLVHAITSPGLIWTNPKVEAEFESLNRVEISRNFTPIKDILSIIGIVKVLYKLKPIIVDAHTPKAGLLGMIASWILGIPVRIYHIHGFPFQTSTGIYRIILKNVERLSCLCSTQVICVGPSLLAEIGNETICKKEKVKVIGSGSINGIDTQRFDPTIFSEREKINIKQKLSIPQKSLILGFVGRLVKDKGVEDLVAAWKLVKSTYIDAHLILVGPFEERNTISKDARDYLLSEESVHIVEKTSDIPRYYSIMDILVLPSHREGLPYAPLEAAAMQVPVITTTVTGCMDVVIDGVTGKHIPPAKPEELSLAILHYFKNPLIRLSHGIEGRKYIVDKYSQVKIWGLLYVEYSRLIEEQVNSLN